ncbi:MAG: prolyl oligopeptidase family protein [Sandaracinaceae bacterium]
MLRWLDARIPSLVTLATLAVPGCGPTAAGPPVAVPPAGGAPPVAEVRPVRDRYHGEEVVDPYRWLEDPEDPTVQAWTRGQSAYARSVLDGLPHRDRIRAQVEEALGASARSYGLLAERGGKLFAVEHRPPREQPVLVVLDDIDAPDEARVLLDPAAEASTTAIDWHVPSPDGSRVAVSLSRGGSEQGDVHVLDVATGQRVSEVVPRVNGGTAGGDLAWLPDGTGFFYTRYPAPGERPPEDLPFYQQLYLHRLGTALAEDEYVLGRELPRIAEIQLDMDHGSGRLLVTVQRGDGGEFALFLREPGGEVRPFSTFGDGAVQAHFGPRDDLYVVSRADAPKGRILRLGIDDLDLASAEVVVPEGEHSLVTDFWDPPTLHATEDRIVAIVQTGGPSELRLFDADGGPLPTPAQPPVSAVRRLVPRADGSLLVRIESYVDPPAWMVLARDGTLRPTALSETSEIDRSGWQVRREMAASRDGTPVPVNLLLPPGTERDGQSPCIAYGYGGYAVSLEPRFRPRHAVALRNGVIFAIANLRGGSEFGEAWHRAGMLTAKQNVFDDFHAVLEHLVERGFTRPERLGILGGSNGGLLMGATLTQHPNAARAVVSFVGIYDMLRVELSPNGAFNVTEFGTVEDEAQYRALRAYSPYHRVEDGVRYPPTLFLTGENDPRVEPWHSRKMTARLQAAQASDDPVLLRTSAQTGHGGDTPLSERVAEWTDAFAFFFHYLGVVPAP